MTQGQKNSGKNDYNKATEGSNVWSIADEKWDGKYYYNMKLEKDFSKKDFLSGSTLHFILNLNKGTFHIQNSKKEVIVSATGLKGKTLIPFMGTCFIDTQISLIDQSYAAKE